MKPLSRGIARRLRCTKCDDFGAPWISNGYPKCDRCWFGAHEPPPPIPKVAAVRPADQWARVAVLVGRVHSRRGPGRDVYRYDGREATLGQWAKALGMTRQGLWKARVRAGKATKSAKPTEGSGDAKANL